LRDEDPGLLLPGSEVAIAGPGRRSLPPHRTTGA